MHLTSHPVPDSVPAPEQGQLVTVRNRLWLVQDVVPHEDDRGPTVTRVDLECLDDDRLGERLSVLWEREVNPRVHHADGFPRPSGRWDHPRVFRSFLTALRWSSTSVLAGGALQSPFRGGIELEYYQLEPAARAVVMPRVNLLIADDVGLGKTVEAGLVLQELIARARVRTCLVLCPASLQRQWQEEMAEKFNLEFRIIDRDAVVRLRREYGVHVNPWTSHPRLITSIDFLKRGPVLQQFLASMERQEGLSNWDLLILDEAHNCAPAGRQRYVRDSDRTRMLRQIAPHFQHRLFLTATPHNGFTESFTALLEQLDPLRFHRGPDVDPDQVRTVMVRRLKSELAGDSQRRFARRTVRAIPVPDDPSERQACELLDRYIRHRIERAGQQRERLAVQFALNLLKKRFLSSPLAFCRSLETHLEHVTRPGSPPPVGEADSELVEQLIRRASEDHADDRVKQELEEEALRESTRFFGELTPDEDRWLSDLWAWAEARRHSPDAKLQELQRWVTQHLQTDGEWNDERLILFTEYRDTLEYIRSHVTRWMGDDRVLILTGGMDAQSREAVKAGFQTPPQEHPVRVLLATDAAAEGLNLQNHCRYLIHYEIPWNPNRLEQRNGRIDRHGQRADEVLILHFVHENRADSRFLRTVLDKVQNMREDLGSVAAVIEKRVEEYMRGNRGVDLERISPRRTLKDDIRQDLWDRQRLRQLRAQVDQARREWDIHPATLRRVLDDALRIEGHPGLEPAQGDLAGRGAVLRRPPAHWGERCAASVKDARGRLLTLVFDPADARDRRDVALVHLNHPLLQRALAAFRKNMFSLGLTETERLHRVTYQVVPGGILESPLLAADVRLLAVGQQGQKLHEEIRTLCWTATPDGLSPAPAELLDQVPEDAPHPSIPARLGRRLELLVERHEGALKEGLARLVQAETARLEAALRDRAEHEVAQVRQMTQKRIDEIRKRLRQIRATPVEQLQFDFMEAEQYREDEQMLRRRLDQLVEDRKAEPGRIRERYRLRDVRAFPLGLRFLLPEPLVEQERS